MSTQSAQNIDIVRRWIDLANANDFEALKDLWSPDCVVHPGADLDDVVGFDAFRALLESFYVGMPDVQVTFEDGVAAGDLVVGRTTSAGTHTGEMLGYAATGRQVVFPGIQVYRVVDGQIVEEWFNDDLFALTQQLAA